MKNKKRLNILAAFIFLVPAYSHAALQPSTACTDPSFRTEVSEDEDYNYKYINPYSIEGCDLGFDFPGFSFDVSMGGFDFCSIAKGVTSKARTKWNDAVDDVNQWTDNNNARIDANEGVSLNGDSVTGGANLPDGGYSAPTYRMSFDENGLPVYQ